MTRPRICSIPGCPTIHEGPGSRCPTHEHAAKRQHWDKTKAYNTKGHRRFREQVLRNDPICVLCQLAQSVVADHHPKGRDELIALGLNPNDPRYGRGLCTPCDKRQSAARQPGGWNKRQTPL